MLLIEYVYFRVPPWLQELVDYVTARLPWRSRAGEEDDEDEDDDSEPPPLEDITALHAIHDSTRVVASEGRRKEKQKEWMVYDAVVGVVPSDLKDSWAQQEEERAELFERLTYINKLKSLPPVRYSMIAVDPSSPEASRRSAEEDVVYLTSSVGSGGASSGSKLRLRTRSGSADMTCTPSSSSRRSRGKSEHVLEEEEDEVEAAASSRTDPVQDHLLTATVKKDESAMTPSATPTFTTPNANSSTTKKRNKKSNK